MPLPGDTKPGCAGRRRDGRFGVERRGKGPSREINSISALERDGWRWHRRAYVGTRGKGSVWEMNQLGALAGDSQSRYGRVLVGRRDKDPLLEMFQRCVNRKSPVRRGPYRCRQVWQGPSGSLYQLGAPAGGGKRRHEAA